MVFHSPTRRLDRLPTVLAVAWALAASACSSRDAAEPAAASTGVTLRIQGSDTMRILAEKWAEAFEAAHEGVDVQVEGGGSGRGIAALLNDATDLANASRPMRERERELLSSGRSKTAKEYPVALDALAIFLHPDNPVKALTLSQLRGIYTGEIRNWKDVGGADERIDVYNREPASGTYAYFEEHVLDGAAYTSDAKVVAETAGVIAALESNPRGIGYGGIAYAGREVHAIAVARDDRSDPVEPTPAHALSGLYPLARMLYVYSAGEPSGAAADYLAFVRSPAGEKIVTEVGYYPLPDALPETAPAPVADAPRHGDAPSGEPTAEPNAAVAEAN